MEDPMQLSIGRSSPIRVTQEALHCASRAAAQFNLLLSPGDMVSVGPEGERRTKPVATGNEEVARGPVDHCHRKAEKHGLAVTKATLPSDRGAARSPLDASELLRTQRTAIRLAVS